MIIQSDTMNTASSRVYRENSYRTSSIATVKTDTIESDEEESSGSSGGFSSLLDLVQQYHSTQGARLSSLQERTEALNQIRQQMLNYLFDLLFGRTSDNSIAGQSTSLDSGDTSSYTMQTTRYTESFYYTENETTCFSTNGTVVTADGRSFDINLELEMSHSFTEATSSFVDYTQPVLCDPLVINLSSGCATVSDQKFYFDLDADGTSEEVSMLNSGSGYLALDKNGDGIINDGSELFGTASGNGFSDLAEYDSDQNGWIDEADEIFSKLKVWSINENGESELLSLKEAGVGAICLKNSSTEFSLKGADNTTNAVIRRTVMFLYENGNVGTVQQLDLAT
jgi:hypothetical protein